MAGQYDGIYGKTIPRHFLLYFYTAVKKGIGRKVIQLIERSNFKFDVGHQLLPKTLIDPADNIGLEKLKLLRPNRTVDMNYQKFSFKCGRLRIISQIPPDDLSTTGWKELGEPAKELHRETSELIMKSVKILGTCIKEAPEFGARKRRKRYSEV